jgi:hypothetical protein
VFTSSESTHELMRDRPLGVAGVPTGELPEPKVSTVVICAPVSAFSTNRWPLPSPGLTLL